MLVSPTIKESKPIDVNVLENKSVASCEVTMPGKFDYMVPTESGIGPIHLPLMAHRGRMVRYTKKNELAKPHINYESRAIM